MWCRSKRRVVAALVASTMLAIGCHSGGGRFARSDSPIASSKAGCASGCCAKPSLAQSASPASPSYSALASEPVSPATARAQRSCPVTGEDLGSMGNPIPVTVKGETIFVCCKGCIKKVQQNPDKYLAKVHAETGG